MKLFRLIFSFIIISLFFVLGISFADKEYLSKNVIGVRIFADDQQSITDVNELLTQLQCSDADELCRMLDSHGILAYLSPTKEYFDDTCAAGHFPYAAYDTIVIDLGECDQIKASYLKKLGAVPGRFECAHGIFATKVQEYYMGFLSYLGKIQECIDCSGF